MTSTFYAYTRVSTQKQGVKGVSLEEQRASIARYAQRNGLHISRWFEERLTAAKKGRPLFNMILSGLRRGDAKGIVIHKIDRGARNLRDWADLGELIDAGVSVHFANESVDLQSRGGRLSADIQAVVASDYIRNLREETLKGIRGRLRQGLYPFYAPIGYLNPGSGSTKQIDPLHGPLMREAFEQMASGGYTLERLARDLYGRGLRNRAAKFVDAENLSKLLRNPFYTGLMVLASTGETFQGKHPALVGMRLFNQVQSRLEGKGVRKMRQHGYLFRGLFRCTICGRYLVGERQKGRVYYRCHAKHCPTRTFREDTLEEALLGAFGALAPTDEWRKRLRDALDYVIAHDGKTEQSRRALLAAQLAAVKERERRLVDAMLDGAINRETFDGRQRTLIAERQGIEQTLGDGEVDTGRTRAIFEEALELASVAQLSYRSGNHKSKRELVCLLSSNRTVCGKHVVVEPSFEMSLIKQREKPHTWSHVSDATRTARELWEWAKGEVLRRQSRRADGSEEL